MEEYKGKSVFCKIAMGPIWYYQKRENMVRRHHIDNVDEELIRFENGKNMAISQLEEIYEKAVLEVGKENAAVFDVHKMMLEDVDFLNSIKNMISEQSVNAEYAVAVVGDNFAKLFAEMEDDYMRGRASDIKDVSERVINALQGITKDIQIKDASIIIADDLAPSETVQLEKDKILAIVTKHGSLNSHTAILARSMNIPALIGVDIDEAWNGENGIVDGYLGKFVINPTDKTITEYENKLAEETNKEKLLRQLKGKENKTKSGRKIELFANIGGVSDLAAVMENDAGGIGLLRSEFLYLEAPKLPSEEEQFKVYKMIAETMAGKKVIIRTLDIGADKNVDYLGLDKESNPAMGYRAIRICLDRVDIFKSQLRAIYRASAYGNILVLFPMIISINEIFTIKRIVCEVKAELKTAGISYKDIPIGVMIETPAAVWISEELAKEVDFFSIGTNDLTQYILAIDRQNEKLDNFYNPRHPAVLKAIRTVVENGHKNGIWVGICGELASDLGLTQTFIDMGVDELSVSPSFILSVRNEIINCD